MTVPSPPQLLDKGRATQNKRCTQRARKPQNDHETACKDACSGLLRNRLCVPLFLTRVLDLEELHMLNRSHRNGLSSCTFGCRLGCHLGSRFGCEIGGFGMRFGSFGHKLGSRFGRELQPAWQAVCLRNPLQARHKHPILHSGPQKTTVPKNPKNGGSTPTLCLDKPVPVQRGGVWRGNSADLPDNLRLLHIGLGT